MLRAKGIEYDAFVGGDVGGGGGGGGGGDDDALVPFGGGGGGGSGAVAGVAENVVKKDAPTNLDGAIEQMVVQVRGTRRFASASVSSSSPHHPPLRDRRFASASASSSSPHQTPLLLSVEDRQAHSHIFQRRYVRDSNVLLMSP